MGWKISKQRKEKRLENGEDFVLIRQMNQGDKDDLLDMMMSMSEDVDAAELKKAAKKKGAAPQSVKLALGKIRHFKRVRSIKEWNLKFDDGTKIPLDGEHIRMLPPELIAEIDEAIEELNPEQSDEKKSE